MGLCDWFKSKESVINSDPSHIPDDCHEALKNKDKKEFEKLQFEAAVMNKLGEIKLAEAIAEWQHIKDSISSYVPPVVVKDYSAGRFLCVEDKEVPCAFIMDISTIPNCKRNGNNKPSWSSAYIHTDGYSYGTALKYYSLRNGFVCHYDRESIEITMNTGRKVLIPCRTVHLEILLDAMIKAWKGDLKINQ